MNRIALSLLLALTPLAAWAATAGEPSAVALTVYNGDLALIKETRPITLAGGTQTVTLFDVSGQLRPDTVHLDTGDLPVSLLEQNYDYDLVSRDKLMERFIGKQISLVNDTTNTVITGTLLSVAGGIVLNSGGQIMLDPPGRVVLPEGAADNLLLRPTLSWMLSSPRAASVNAEVSYLSGGLSWEADYVLMLAADEKTGGMEGWVTLSNYSGTTYNDASLKLVAGEVNRVPDYKQMQRMGGVPAPAPMAAEAADGFVEESFFEYHLYNLQRQTTLKNNQQKQIGLLTAPSVPMTKIYEFNGQGGGPVRVTVEFENKDDFGLGMPLPEGVVRVFKQDRSGSAQFVGEDRIKHTPREEKVRLFVGNAFDIVGEATQTNYTDLGNGYEQTYKVELRNRKKDEAAEIRVAAHLGGEWQVLNSNYDYVKKDAYTAEFVVPVAADSTATLNYTVRVTWK